MTWPPSDLPVAVAFLTAAAALGFHHYALAPRALARRFAVSQPASVLLGRVLGGMVLGVFPLLALALAGGPGDVGLGPIASVASAAGWTLGAAALLFPVLLLAGRRPAQRARYPQARPDTWAPRFHAANAVSWAIYLLGYELLFRGVLLFPLAPQGAWSAIAVTTALYTLAHLPKDAGEFAGCLFAGVGFAALALHTGAIWAPFALHVFLAVTNDALSVTRSISAPRAERRLPARV